MTATREREREREREQILRTLTATLLSTDCQPYICHFTCSSLKSHVKKKGNMTCANSEDRPDCNYFILILVRELVSLSLPGECHIRKLLAERPMGSDCGLNRLYMWLFCFFLPCFTTKPRDANRKRTLSDSTLLHMLFSLFFQLSFSRIISNTII